MPDQEFYSSKDQNPSGIWQGIWANLIYQFNMTMIEGNYKIAWKIIQLLRDDIPPECIEETEEDYKKAKATMERSIKAYDAREAAIIRNRQKPFEAEVLRELNSGILASLFKNGWINKNFNISPLNKTKPHITSGQQ